MVIPWGADYFSKLKAAKINLTIQIKNHNYHVLAQILM